MAQTTAQLTYRLATALLLLFVLNPSAEATTRRLLQTAGKERLEHCEAYCDFYLTAFADHNDLE